MYDCVHLCAWYPQRPEVGIRSLRKGVTDGYKLGLEPRFSELMRQALAVSPFIKAECVSGSVGKPWKLAMLSAGKMALWIKALAMKPEDLCSVPRTSIKVEADN